MNIWITKLIIHTVLICILVVRNISHLCETHGFRHFRMYNSNVATKDKITKLVHKNIFKSFYPDSVAFCAEGSQLFYFIY